MGQGERSVLLLQVSVPSGSSVPLERPELRIDTQACPALLDGGFALRLDGHPSRARYLGPGSATRLFSVAVLGLDTELRPIDVLPLAECGINRPVTLRFRATSDLLWVDDPGSAAAVPSSRRSAPPTRPVGVTWITCVPLSSVSSTMFQPR
jgi:hypothetical protein